MIEELRPDKCYNCCVSVLSDAIYKLGEYYHSVTTEDNNGKQWHDFAYSRFYERYHIYLQHCRIDN